ncbi:MAG TPA: hypothetical protein VLS28_03810 [Candidatus Sulfomarinibacteraceae bacterium]|nr:hypothetical protein [Candidatus Sulfomarinibacteraceae bacterium]
MADRYGPEFHEAHDLEQVARAAAGDLAAGEVTAAHRLLAACDRCAALAADLRAIAAATRRLPSASAALPASSARPPRPAGPARDFRLTEADAARLRRRGWPGIGRLGEILGSRSRGFGGALATFGLVGLLVAAGMPTLLGGAGGAGSALAPAGESLAQQQAASAAPASVEAVPAGPIEAPAPTDLYRLTATDAPARGAMAVGDAARPADDTGDAATDASSGWFAVALALVSAVVLVVGLNLLLAGRNGRRAGP